MPTEERAPAEAEPEENGWLWTRRQVEVVGSLGYWLRVVGWFGVAGGVLVFLYGLLNAFYDLTRERGTLGFAIVRVVLLFVFTIAAVALVSLKLVSAGRGFTRAARSQAEYEVHAGLRELRFVFRLQGWFCFVVIGGLASSAVVSVLWLAAALLWGR